jgi:hypothetical protein
MKCTGTHKTFATHGHNASKRSDRPEHELTLQVYSAAQTPCFVVRIMNGARPGKPAIGTEFQNKRNAIKGLKHI